ncbi:MAG: glucose-1-phosphate cytidylyltransferase [Patescibacteria group bacterium]
MNTSFQKEIDKSKIPVVILCGGKGTRLREETETIPKPLVRIGEHPILWHIMKIYNSFGFSNFILPTGYKGEKIKDYFFNYPIHQGDFTIDFTKEDRNVTVHVPAEERWRVTIAGTGLNAETGARLKRITSYIAGDIFLLTYGDGVANVNIDDLLAFHLAQGKMVTITGVRPPARFGQIKVRDSGVQFTEKSQLQDNYINGGFFVCNRSVLDRLSDDEKLNFERDVLPKLASESQLAVYYHNGYWQCMDTVRDTELLNEEWNKGTAAWKTWR